MTSASSCNSVLVVLSGVAASCGVFFARDSLGFAVGFSDHNGRTIDSQRPFAWQDSARSSQIEVLIKTVNLKTDMPRVHEALERLDGELARARQQRCTVLKLIHGYGSTGAGGDIRIAVQKRLYEMAQNGQIRACIYGENWSKSNEEAWKLLEEHPDLKNDSDVGRANRGITIVLL
jgi:hypothetical protein